MAPREEVMRYLVAAFFLASCTALTPSSTDNASVNAPARGAPEQHAPASEPLPMMPESEPEARKSKPKAPAPPSARNSFVRQFEDGGLERDHKGKARLHFGKCQIIQVPRARNRADR